MEGSRARTSGHPRAKSALYEEKGSVVRQVEASLRYLVYFGAWPRAWRIIFCLRLAACALATGHFQERHVWWRSTTKQPVWATGSKARQSEWARVLPTTIFAPQRGATISFDVSHHSASHLHSVGPESPPRVHRVAPRLPSPSSRTTGASTCACVRAAGAPPPRLRAGPADLLRAQRRAAPGSGLAGPHDRLQRGRDTGNIASRALNY